MYAIQSGLNGWVNSISRISAYDVKGRSGIGALFNLSDHDQKDIFESSDSMNYVISDYEEEGETSEFAPNEDAEESGIDNVLDDVESNNHSSAAEEIVAAVAKHIEVIEQAMRQHQTNGTSKFLDEDEANKDYLDESFNDALKDDMMQNSMATFAATSPSLDRQGLFALLKA